MERRSGKKLGKNTQLMNRRNYLRAVGVGAMSLGAMGAASGTAAAAEYETIKVGAGESKSLHVGSGETLENTLIDVSAKGADLLIKAEGNDWTIRNVGVKGKFDVGENGGHGYVIRFDGNGLIENVYLGDGFKFGKSSKGAMLSGPEHSGHVTIRNCYVAGWSDNAIYAAGSGRVSGPGQADGQGGNYTFENCYFRDNNISHLRLAADGTTVKGCVFHNTNRVRPEMNTSAGQSDVVNSRGIYTGYGNPNQVITVEDCDFNITGQNTCNSDKWDYSACGASVAHSGEHSTYGQCSTVRIQNSRINGQTHGNHVQVANSTETGADAPNIRVPAGVPKNAKEAASGNVSTSANEATDSNNQQTKKKERKNVLSITGLTHDVVRYDLEVTGSLSRSDANGATKDKQERVNGSTATGIVEGGIDSYVFTGKLVSLSLDGDVKVTLNGKEINPKDY